MRKFLKNKLGLSLVELVVTITIMAILAAWLIPSLISSKQDSDMKMDKSAVESLQSAVHIASQDSEIYMKAKVLADSSSNKQIKLVYTPSEDGTLVLSSAYIKDGKTVVSSNDANGTMLRDIMTAIDNKVNSTMDPVVLKTAEAKELSYCFIITFPDVKFKTNIEYYSATKEEVSNHWQDIEDEEIIPTTPDELPDITEPTEPPPPPPPAKKPGEVTKHPVAKTGLVYTGNPHELIVPGSGTGTLYYSITSATEGFATTIPSGTNAGTYTVWYYAAATSTHLQSETFSLTVEIDKANYNIVPPTAQAPVYDGNPHTLISAGSSKYGKMNYKLEGGSWGQALPSATEIGTYKIYYYGTGDANHHPTSKEAYITATISPSKTATYSVSNYTYNNKTYTGVVGENIIIKGTNTAKDAGIYTVTIEPEKNFTWADGKINVITLTWEIARAQGSCTPPTVKTLEYTGSAQQLINPASGNSGTVYYKVNNGSWTTQIPTATNAGAYKIYYKMDPTTNYTGIDETFVGTASIGKLMPVVTPPTAQNLTYNGSAQTLILRATTTGGTLKYALDNGSYSTSLPRATNAGTYTVWYYVEGDDNYESTAKESIQVTIKKANSSYVAPTAKTLYYNGQAQQLINAGSNSTPGTFGYKLSTDSGYQAQATSIKGTAAQGYTIQWKFTPTDSNNYNGGQGSFTATIQANGLLFNPNGGTVKITQGYPNNTKYTALPIPTKDNTTFQKWVYNCSGGHLALDTQFKYTGKISVHLEAYMDKWTDAKTALISCTNSSGWNLVNEGSGNIQVNMWDSGANAYKSIILSKKFSQLSPGWHTFDIIFDGSYGYLYIDGTQEGKTAKFSGTLSYPDDDTSVIIGHESGTKFNTTQSDFNLFQGKIANVMINNNSTRITNTNCFIVPYSGVTTLVAEYANVGTCTAPTVKNLTYTGSAQQLINPAKNATGTVYYKIGENGAWSTSVPTATDVGSYTIYYSMAAENGYTGIKETLVGTATISKKTATVTAPSAKSLTYNGNDQALVNAGSTNGGTIKYSTTQNGTYSTTIPTGKNAGSYTVWWYLDGGNNYNSTSKKSISVTINKANPTYTAPKAISNLTFNNSAQTLITAGSNTTPGSFTYKLSTASSYSTALPKGTAAITYTVNWMFTPTDTTNYNSKSGNISVTIGGAPAVDYTYSFGYTGSIQTFTAPVAGYYNLEVWGAQGGRSRADGALKDTGGYGGYSSGDVYLEAGETIYIAVGGKGSDPAIGYDATGGWNGGGNSTHDHSDDEVAGAGGGATSITKGTQRGDGQLKNYSSYKSQVLIVAGGGGGGEWTFTDSAGVGGGLNGGLGTGCKNMSAATQSSGAAFGQGGSATYPSSWGANQAADGLAGGGGGWYGGYAATTGDNYASTGGATSSAGGGSAYIDGVYNGVTISGVRSGNGTAKVTYRGTSKPSGGTNNTTSNTTTFNYTGNVQTFTAPAAGYYFIETWGAQGGSKYGTGGYGGYSNGYVYLNKGEVLYVYVGNQPSSSSDTAGWNGGGAGYSGGSASVYYSAGGGASDVRKGGQALSNRIIVAGGGGGGAYYATPIQGGTGGGLESGKVYYANYGSTMAQSGNVGATVNHGGATPVDGAAPGGYMPGVSVGSLGQGAASGGGGYYGGPQYNCGNRVYAGGGGSGYIGGVINGASVAGVQSGNGQVKITLSKNAGDAAVTTSSRWTYAYTGGAQTFIAPVSGYYNLYAYGAAGGAAINNSDSSMNGYGAMIRGAIWLDKGQVLYIYVGQAGTYSTGSGETGGNPAPATFNGGGDGGVSMMSTHGYAGAHLGGSGGGATDFRLVGGAWNNPEGLKSRILVAGGGGGQGCASSHNRGHGSSDTGVTTKNTGYYNAASSTGGTQTSGGYGVGTYTQNGTTYGCASASGGFGYGANATLCGAGGGGGWYGGGSGYTSGGGGGSSFIAGMSWCTTDYASYRNGLKFVSHGTLTGVQEGHGEAIIYYLGNTYY